MRIDKFLHDQQFGTRSEVHQLITKRQVTIDGQVVKAFKTVIDPQKNIVEVAGQKVTSQQDFYYLLNKPVGVITATKDKKQSTVMDLLADDAQRNDLFAVGRLDKDTTGVLLITNDGQLAHRLVSPKQHVAKTYRVTISGILDAAQLAPLMETITLRDGTRVKAEQVEIMTIGTNEMVLEITIHEGKYHQIKRMMGYLGQRVTKLDRVSFAGLTYEGLAPGQYRPLTPSEIEIISK